jgi:glutathione synthase/RimK-type ligase-like ATP-grasp enzyme
MRISPQSSFDTLRICELLEKAGYTPVISHYEDPGLHRLIADVDVRWCWPATSYSLAYRHLVESVLVNLADRGMSLVPKLSHFLAYENKSLQAQVIASHDIPSPRTIALGSAEGLRRAAETLGFPFVAKTSDGWGSSGVRLVRSASELQSIVNEWFSEHQKGTEGLGSAVAQQFIPDLKGDWKVIIAGSVAAAMWRFNRPGDFRASGSGELDERLPPMALLEFAYQVQRQLDAPWASIDIADARGEYRVIEYQVVHFGTTVTDICRTHFRRESANRWRTQEGAVDLEREMTKSLLEYVDQRSAAETSL